MGYQVIWDNEAAPAYCSLLRMKLSPAVKCIHDFQFEGFELVGYDPSSRHQGADYGVKKIQHERTKIMKLTNGIVLSLLITIVTAWAQVSPHLRNTFVEGFGDLGAIKLQAEQGDVAAQIKLADAYLSHSKSADALTWYSAAAKNNSLEGKYQTGRLLLFGRFGSPVEQQVASKPAEGLKLTYEAAVLGHRGARRDMAAALKDGVGCAKNLVEAYAWLTLDAEVGSIVSRVEVNNLSLKLSSGEILRGKSLAQVVLK
jgi:TPR repeat protein